MSESCLTDLNLFGILGSLLMERNSRFADGPTRFGNPFEIDIEGVARMPSPGYRSAPKLFGLVLVATVVWLMTTSPASAAFWFPLPVQPNPGNVPLPPPNQVVPNGGGGNPIEPPDVPPPDVPPNSTPEPASILLGLVGVGTVGLVGFWRRQRRRGAF
jgi:PEP-CTERM motif